MTSLQRHIDAHPLLVEVEESRVSLTPLRPVTFIGPGAAQWFDRTWAWRQRTEQAA